MSIIDKTHPSGIEIRYDDDEHRYETDNCKDFVSATTFIGTFFEKFDIEAVSKRSGAKRGVDPEVLKQEWKQNGIDACALGNNVHLYCENYLKGLDLPEPINEKAASLIQQVLPTLGQLKKLYVSRPEMIVFSERLQLAGTIDVFSKRKVQLGVYLFDWKTNKEIVTYNRYRKYAKMPIQHLADTNFTKYSLQLNLYEYMLKYENYIPKKDEVKKALVHISEKGAKPIPVPNMQREIQAMIDYRLNELEIMKYGNSDGVVP